MNDKQAAAFGSLIKSLTKKHGVEPADPSVDLCPNGCDGVLHELVYSSLLWEASHVRATKAIGAIQEAFVDYNELRVCYPEEVVDVIGAKYPRAEERTTRLRAALDRIFAQENRTSLARLRELPKRDARAVLGSLPGVPGFVAARVALLALGAHAFPVDDRVAGVLTDAGAADEGVGADEIAGQMERAVRAGEAMPAYLLIEASLGGRRKPRKDEKTSAAT